MPSAPCAPLAVLKSKTSFARSPLPVSMLQQGQLLFVAPEYQGGLILQKPFYTDFVGPGAAIGASFDSSCTAIHPLGIVNFRVPTTLRERQQAYQKRIHYSDRLAEIASTYQASRRAALIVAQLCEWVGVEEAQKIPLELVAQMAGVSTKLIRTVWDQRAEHCQFVSPKAIAPSMA
ncbi:MAG: hypothetical protein ACAF41_09260 [Leptolyngbya sp. BL-A-14]